MTEELKKLILTLKDFDEYYKTLPDDRLIWLYGKRRKEKWNESFKEFIEDYRAKEQMQWEAEHCKDYL